MARTYLLRLAFAAVALVIVSCSSAADEPSDSTSGAGATTPPVSTSPAGSASTVIPGGPTPRATTSTPEPEFVGYALDLAEGDFWEYRWSYVDGSCYRFKCSSDKDDGVFQLTLGEQREVEGVPVFELVVTGKSAVSVASETRNFAPRWRYLGSIGERIVVSDGNTLTTLFDGGSGKWAGSGFFTGKFDVDELIVARSGSLGAGSEIADWPGVKLGPWESVGRSDSQSACEIIAGKRICPNEDTFSFTENEYYRPGIGPVAYQFRNSVSFDGLTNTYSTTEWVALVASSLRGDAAPTAAMTDPMPVGGISTVAPAISTVTPPVSQPVQTATPAVFGPSAGGLLLYSGSNQIPDFSSGVSLDRAIVEVNFTIPDIPNGRWSQGITFRQSEEETFHAVYITGTGRWGHFARTGAVGSEPDLDSGTVSFDPTPGGSVWLKIVFGETAGQFFLNDEPVADLDLSLSAVLPPGDIRVMSGLFGTDTLDGSEVSYSNFTVWSRE